MLPVVGVLQVGVCGGHIDDLPAPLAVSGEIESSRDVVGADADPGGEEHVGLCLLRRRHPRRERRLRADVLCIILLGVCVAATRVLSLLQLILRKHRELEVHRRQRRAVEEPLLRPIHGVLLLCERADVQRHHQLFLQLGIGRHGATVRAGEARAEAQAGKRHGQPPPMGQVGVGQDPGVDEPRRRERQCAGNHIGAAEALGDRQGRRIELDGRVLG
mmetsp:Transcript_96343/g.278100  ORF Transcript_96343/g.278100 Transcript_96343/m.278100 type:complete len:217 (-) Transcript_96343:2654-3304(-)